MDNQQATLTEAHIAWLAGIIEGEGSLSMNAYERKDRSNNMKVQTTIVIYNTDAGIIRQALSILDAMDIAYYVREREQKPMLHEGGKYLPTAPMLIVLVKTLTGSLKLLTSIRPWLFGDKAARAEIMLQYLTRRLERIKANGDNHRNVKMDKEDFEIVSKFYRLTKRSNENTVKRVLNELERCTTAGVSP